MQGTLSSKTFRNHPIWSHWQQATNSFTPLSAISSPFISLSFQVVIPLSLRDYNQVPDFVCNFFTFLLTQISLLSFSLSLSLSVCFFSLSLCRLHLIRLRLFKYTLNDGVLNNYLFSCLPVGCFTFIYPLRLFKSPFICSP